MKIVTKIPPFKIDGIGAAKWKEDILMQYQEVAHKSQLTKPEKIKKTLEENLSAKDKLANDLAAISDMMND